MRWTKLGVATAVVVLLGSTALAAEPAGCTWPTSSDDFQSVSPGFRIVHTYWNKVLCAINALQDEVDSVAHEVRSGCAATSLTPGERKLIGVSLTGSPLLGTEPVFASVKDATVPSRLEVDGIQELTSNQAKVWVFNHDPAFARSGTVCALVVQ